MQAAVAIAAALLAAAAFTHGFARLRARGRRDLAGWDRAGVFALALALWLAALSAPMDAAADRSLAAHMLEHVIIGDGVPALVLVALRGPLLLFVLPPTLLKRLARSTPLRALMSALGRPAVAFGLWALALGVWHVPGVYDRTLESAPLHALQHASFVTAGFLVWNQLVDPAGRRRLSLRGRAAFALAMFVAGEALVNTLILTYTPLFPAYGHQPHPLLGMSPLIDQQSAGLVMSAEQVLTIGTFAVVLIRNWLRTPTALVRPARHPFLS